MAIQLFTPKYDVEACLEEIRECLEIGWTGLGYKTVKFEEAWKEYTGWEHAYYLNSATAGLNVAFDLMKMHYNWTEEDEIITTPLTFISTNHAIAQAGLKAVFADVDDTLCLDPESVRSRITDRTRAVLFVGLGGNTGHFKEIAAICKEKNIHLILDAAHMSGTRYTNGETPGQEADVVIYSFQAVKNLPTADSGMICFKDAELDKITREYCWLGINKDTYARTNSAGNYKWRYDVEYVGNKYHGNSIMAAIGLVQLTHLDEDNDYRRQLAEWYTEYFKGHEDKIGLVTIPDDCVSSRHLFQIMVENRDEVMVALNEKEIFPGVHYVDNTQYRMYAYAQGTCPKAEYASEHVISLPMHLHLTREDVKFIAESVIEIVGR